MEIKICARCKRPFLPAKSVDCPHCPEPYTWNQESWANLGCLLGMFVPLIVMIFFWLFFFLGIFFR